VTWVAGPWNGSWLLWEKPVPLFEEGDFMVSVPTALRDRVNDQKELIKCLQAELRTAKEYGEAYFDEVVELKIELERLRSALERIAASPEGDLPANTTEGAMLAALAREALRK